MRCVNFQQTGASAGLSRGAQTDAFRLITAGSVAS